MPNQRTLVNFSHGGECQGEEMKRRISECRERLRRNRAARRIPARAFPLDENSRTEEAELSATAPLFKGREKKV